MLKEIYEAKPFYGINPAFVILCVIIGLIILLTVVFWKKADRGVRCFSLLIAAFLLLIVAGQTYTAIDSKRNVYDKYQAGNYYTVEGQVYDYTLAEKEQPDLPDYFCVGGIEFQIPGFVSAWGYPLKRIDGGIVEDGMYVKICYIPYKCENVIMKLEQLE